MIDMEDLNNGPKYLKQSRVMGNITLFSRFHSD